MEDHYYEGNRPWAREPGADGSGKGWGHRATGKGPQRAGRPSSILPQDGSWDLASCWPQAWPGTQQTWLLAWLLGAPAALGAQKDRDLAAKRRRAACVPDRVERSVRCAEILSSTGPSQSSPPQAHTAPPPGQDLGREMGSDCGVRYKCSFIQDSFPELGVQNDSEATFGLRRTHKYHDRLMMSALAAGTGEGGGCAVSAPLG